MGRDASTMPGDLFGIPRDLSVAMTATAVAFGEFMKKNNLPDPSFVFALLKEINIALTHHITTTYEVPLNELDEVVKETVMKLCRLGDEKWAEIQKKLEQETMENENGDE